MRITKGIASPAKFLVQADALVDLALHGKAFGGNAYLICDQFIVGRVHEKAMPTVKSTGTWRRHAGPIMSWG